MRRNLIGLALGLVLLAGRTAGADAPRTAHASLIDKRGHVIGHATLVEEPNGVDVHVVVHGLPPGDHGIHIHNVGKADPPEFTTAGGHFNPDHRQHGLDNPNGSHAGDLPNLVVDAGGHGELDFLSEGATLGNDDHSLFHPGGTALVIHAAHDDGKTDPTGNSGARIAAGVIQRDR